MTPGRDRGQHPRPTTRPSSAPADRRGPRLRVQDRPRLLVRYCRLAWGVYHEKECFLDPIRRELMILGIVAFQGRTELVEFHIRRALLLGCPVEALLEALEVTFVGAGNRILFDCRPRPAPGHQLDRARASFDRLASQPEARKGLWTRRPAGRLPADASQPGDRRCLRRAGRPGRGRPELPRRAGSGGDCTPASASAFGPRTSCSTTTEPSPPCSPRASAWRSSWAICS